jgi:hypothetical protein
MARRTSSTGRWKYRMWCRRLVVEFTSTLWERLDILGLGPVENHSLLHAM